MDEHNLALARRLQSDGRVYVTSVLIDNRAYLRPCIVNYRSSVSDVQALVDLTVELGEQMVSHL